MRFLPAGDSWVYYYLYPFTDRMEYGKQIDYSNDQVEAGDMWVLTGGSGPDEVQVSPPTWVERSATIVSSPLHHVEGFSHSFFLLSSPPSF